MSTDIVVNKVALLQTQEESTVDLNNCYVFIITFHIVFYFLENAPIPIGRRDVRTPQTFMNSDKSFYRIPRPMSSQNGKQGMK